MSNTCDLSMIDSLRVVWMSWCIHESWRVVTLLASEQDSIIVSVSSSYQTASFRIAVGVIVYQIPRDLTRTATWPWITAICIYIARLKSIEDFFAFLFGSITVCIARYSFRGQALLISIKQYLNEVPGYRRLPGTLRIWTQFWNGNLLVNLCIASLSYTHCLDM